MPNLLPTAIILTIWCASFALGVSPLIFFGMDNSVATIFLTMLFPPIFVLSFISIAGTISIPARKSIKPGKFPRVALHKVYFWRRVYGTCWTQIYYFKPIFAISLSIPILKKYLFRIFGYRGSSIDFTTYPDTWIRDLPVLDIGAGAYLANRATIGTNICLSSNIIYVDKIQLGERALVGHLAVLGPGVRIKAGAEIGVNVTIGIRAVVGENSSVKPLSFINHGAVIGNDVEVGSNAYIGMKAKIGDGIRVPAGANIPAGAIITSQSEVDEYHSSETKKLRDHVMSMTKAFERGTFALET